ncbi:2Fe-2S iron-sulfur cluster-binding protein [Streptomyces sp. JNUCC 63]
MTDDQHGEGAPGSGGRWDPLPQGDYDDGATAFVKLPEGGIDALLAADSPLAAPGQGYVPPQITVTSTSTAATDPAATGSWAVPGAPAEGARWPEPGAVPPDTGAEADDRFTYRPEATQHWTFDETRADRAAEAPHASGQDVTGQWSIPVAGGDIPDESGEFTTSSLIQQWGGTPPATLPGGASAPWATEAVGEAWSRPRAETEPGGQPADGTHARGSAEGGHGTESAQDPYRAGTSAGGAHGGEWTSADARAEGRRAGAPHAGEEPASPERETTASAATGGRPPAAPGHDTRTSPEPGAEVPRGPVPGAVEAGEVAAAAAEGPAEPPARPDAAGDTGPSSRAPEGPVTGADTATARQDAPRPDTTSPATTSSEGPPSSPPQDEHPLASYVLRVNGADRPVTEAWIGESLLYVLRERLGLAGAKDGCSQGECGACNVQVDGRLVASCLVPAVTAAGSEVRTVEGLAVDGQPSDVQRALARCGAVQCGFCVPGMAMTVHDLLEGNPDPTELETRQALCGNLCRCSGYRGVLQAVKEVVAEREAHASTDDAEPDTDEPRIPHQAGPGDGGVHPSAFESPRPHDPYGQDGGRA